MNRSNSKTLLSACLLLLAIPLAASAAELFTLDSLSAGEVRNLDVNIPEVSAAPEAAVGSSLNTVAGYDASLNSALTPAQWDEVFATEQTSGLSQAGITREIFSDFAARYVLNGTLQLDRVPQIFTTLEGKVYRVVKYPKWLKSTGSTQLCVEGYIRQQDNTGEIAIDTVLPLDAAQAYKPSAATVAMQRHPYIISSDPRGYTLANVNWGVRHSADGRRLRGKDGVFKLVWANGVLVRPDLLEAAYVGKKSMQSFPYAGVHGFLVFKLKPGGVTDANGNSVRGLVVSLNTYSLVPGKQNQGIIDGLLGKYAVYYNIDTAEGYVEQNVFTDGNRISLYPLTIPRDRQIKLLRNAIEQATATRTGEMYSLIYNSCTNAALSFVNSVLDEKDKIKDGWMPEIVYRLSATIPDAATSLLIKRGLVAKPLPYLDETNYKNLFQE
jgi:hypothetical protein